MDQRVLLDSRAFQLALVRLCHQLIENHKDFANTAIIGIQPRGIFLSDRLTKLLQKTLPQAHFDYGKLDITFYRDDFRRRQKTITPSETDISFSIEGKKVVLMDDVLYTGRTIRSALDALLDYGRPAHVELLALIDRRLKRHVPIRPDYVGKTIDSIDEEKVKVEWQEHEGQDVVNLLTERETKEE